MPKVTTKKKATTTKKPATSKKVKEKRLVVDGKEIDKIKGGRGDIVAQCPWGNVA